MKKLITLLLALSMVLSLVACGSKADAPAADAPAADAPAADAPAADAPAAGGDYEGKLAWYFPCVVAFGENLRAGVEAYSAENNVPIKVITGTDFTQNAENAQVEALLGMGYKYYSIAGVDGAGVNGLYEQLVDEGCVVNNMGWDSLHPTVANHLIATDIPLSAEKGAEKLCELMGYKGNILVCFGPITDTTYPDRRNAILSVIDKYPDMKIVTELADMITPEATLTKFSDGLTAHMNEIDGILSVGADPASICSVLEDVYAKGADRMKSVLIDIDDVVVEAIKNGTIDGTIVQNEFGIGYISGEVLRLQADGWVPKEGAYHIDTGIVFVDKNNIDSYAEDLEVVTADILAKLTTDYMEKG